MDTSKIDQIKQWLGSGAINIFGRPFSGKDTQGETLAELLGGTMISSGDVLRHDHGNSEVQRIMAEGGIIPSDLFEEIVVPYLSRDEFANKPLILSEVGRVDGEQHMILRATDASNHHQKAVVLLKLSDEEVFRRFDAAQKDHDRGDRDDDRREVLQNRLDKYESMVKPVIEFYREAGQLIEVDGALPKETVTAEIVEKLHQLSQ